jgi:hypothetical protein
MNVLELVAGPIMSIIDKIIPDPQAKQAAQLKFLELQQSGELRELDAEVRMRLAAADIVKAEAQGEGVLQRNWRPVLMLTFGGLIVARWLGWSAPNLAEDEVLKLWDIVQLGLGGYVIGRSAEKILPQITAALKR